MAVLNKLGERSRAPKNFFQACLDENLLQACRPSTEKGTTIIRIVPEVIDGEIRPMLNNMTPNGPDVSGVHLEEVVVNSGKSSKFTGLGMPSDVHIEDAPNMVFPGLYIRLKSLLSKKEIPAGMVDEVRSLFEGGREAPLKRPRLMGIFQAVVITFQDKKLEKPRPKQAVFLTTTALEAINDLIVKCHEEGTDLFSPSEGRAIILEPEEQRGSGIWLFNARLGDKVPIPEETCKKLWVPWEQALRRSTYDQQIKAACSCFGKRVVEIVFEEDVRRVMGADEAKPASASAPASSPDESTEGSEGHSGLTEVTEALQIDTELPSDGPLGDEDEEQESSAAESTDLPPSDAGESGDGASAPASAEELASQYEDLLGDEPAF